MACQVSENCLLSMEELGGKRKKKAIIEFSSKYLQYTIDTCG